MKKLKLTLKTIKSSLVQNSGIDVRQNIFLNSLNKLVYRKPRNKRDRLGHMRYPEPGYTLYKEKQADNSNVKKKMKINCQVSVHKKPVLTETFLTPTSSLTTRSTLSSLVTFTSTWSNKHNPVHEHEPLYGHLCSSGMPLSYNDPNTIPPPPPKKVMKPATFNRSRSCINFETFFYAVTSTPGIHTRNACT